MLQGEIQTDYWIAIARGDDPHELPPTFLQDVDSAIARGDAVPVRVTLDTQSLRRDLSNPQSNRLQTQE